jgi:hypothetical protein
VMPSRNQTSAPYPEARRARLEQIGGSEDEDLAHHVRLLLVAAHETDHLAPRGLFDDGVEALAHQLLELHPLLDHGRSTATLAQRFLDPGVAAAQDTDDEIVLVVGLGLGRAAAVELLEQGDQAVGDRGQLIAMAAPRLERRLALLGIELRSRDPSSLAQRATLDPPFVGFFPPLPRARFQPEDEREGPICRPPPHPSTGMSCSPR